MLKKIILMFFLTLFSQTAFAYQQYMHLFYELGLSRYTTIEHFGNAVDDALYYGDGSGRIMIINYKKSINEHRLVVINILEESIKYVSVSPHGMGSGGMYAVKFSDKFESNQTSLGTLVLKKKAKEYVKYPSKLKYPDAAKAIGVSKGRNENAWARAIVLHTAKYANPTAENFKMYNGRIGRSKGCPVLPEVFEYNGKLVYGQEVVDYMLDGGIIYSHA